MRIVQRSPTMSSVRATGQGSVAFLARVTIDSVVTTVSIVQLAEDSSQLPVAHQLRGEEHGCGMTSAPGLNSKAEHWAVRQDDATIHASSALRSPSRASTQTN
jgi:hypothetical protein